MGLFRFYGNRMFLPRGTEDFEPPRQTDIRVIKTPVAESA
ncbi:hypothetical protein EVB27_125 [Rhizobium phage RHph_TM16]|nr:hypothetical protein EVB27_125 [Rhizobium phage RHph_TM16]